MMGGAAVVWTTIGVALDLTGAIALVSVAIWLVPRRDRFAQAGMPIVAALFLTALWCLAVALVSITPHSALAVSVLESIRNLLWLWVIFRLFASDGRESNVAPIRPVMLALAFVACLHLLLDYFSISAFSDQFQNLTFDVNVLFRLLVAVGGLVLVHNLYAGAPREMRSILRWPAIGLAALWAFELNLYTIAYLGGSWPVELGAFRGLSTIALAVCVGLAALTGNDELRIRPSRAVTFQTFSLLVIGVYLVGMVALAQWLFYAGGDFARLLELVFLTLACSLALAVLPSRRLRSWLKVILAKHFFQHRYDYREEWLRFTTTIGSGGDQSQPLGERVVQSVADVFDSPAGLLLTPSDQGELTLAARWNWPEIEVPSAAIPLHNLEHFERTGYITDLDEVRALKGMLEVSGKAGRQLLQRASRKLEDEGSAENDVPQWLLNQPRAWAMIPLVHYDRLVGMVVLARPQVTRPFDWEDFDLLRVIGQQVASYLAENASQIALAESARFEDFHRRIAFVMHDIKNLASQFSLLARNAELHAEKPAFRVDMLVTLRNSSDKLNALLARLSRYGSGAVERLEPVQGGAVLNVVLERYKANKQVILSESSDLLITANRNSLEQVLMHLVQNAIDASDENTPIFMSLTVEKGTARFEILDSGCGMSAEFVRNSLFKPFISTKSGGFGIGAFEARELVRAMRGRLDVESREGLGSRFVVRLPLVDESSTNPALASSSSKVA